MVAYIQKDDIGAIEFKNNAIFGVYGKTPQLFEFTVKFVGFELLVKRIFSENTLFYFRFVFDM